MEFKPHISVCICTFRRADLLQKLLSHLGGQLTESLFDYSVVIADNDRQESARCTAESFAARSAYEIHYYVEPVQNIARARNRAVRESRGDLIAFIDDDQYPAADWLLRLYRTMQVHGADGALGPVVPHYDVTPPAWVLKGRFHERPRYPTGLVIDWRKGRTGNVLLRGEVLRRTAEPFNPIFLTGEDQDFFRRVIDLGYRFVWCNEAVAYETIPPVRWSRSFLVRRALLRGKVSLAHGTSKGPLILRSLIAVPAYALALPFCSLLGQHVFTKYLVKLCDHAGRLLAVAGIDPVGQHYVTG